MQDFIIRFEKFFSFPAGSFEFSNHLDYYLLYSLKVMSIKNSIPNVNGPSIYALWTVFMVEHFYNLLITIKHKVNKKNSMPVVTQSILHTQGTIYVISLTVL